MQKATRLESLYCSRYSQVIFEYHHHLYFGGIKLMPSVYSNSSHASVNFLFQAIEDYCSLFCNYRFRC